MAFIQTISTTVHQTDLSLAGLLFLAPLLPLPALATRAALAGGRPSWLDFFILEPGMQTPIRPTALNEGEYPACAAMTTGYVFRVENQATVFFLQRVGRAGCLTTIEVGASAGRGEMSNLRTGIEIAIVLFPVVGIIYPFLSDGYDQEALDLWFLAILSMLYVSRLLNIFVLRRRSAEAWHGAPEPNVEGDLLILLSQDRWVRIKGFVDDLKAVTSGSWLRESSFMESTLTFIATLLVYLAAILALNATAVGKFMLLLLALVQLPLLCMSNWLRLGEGLQMHDRILTPTGPPKQYKRRLDLADELIKETKCDDWAIKLGMVNRREDKTGVSQPPDEDLTM